MIGIFLLFSAQKIFSGKAWCVNGFLLLPPQRKTVYNNVFLFLVCQIRRSRGKEKEKEGGRGNPIFHLGDIEFFFRLSQAGGCGDGNSDSPTHVIKSTIQKIRTNVSFRSPAQTRRWKLVNSTRNTRFPKKIHPREHEGGRRETRGFVAFVGVGGGPPLFPLACAKHGTLLLREGGRCLAPSKPLRTERKERSMLCYAHM